MDPGSAELDEAEPSWRGGFYRGLHDVHLRKMHSVLWRRPTQFRFPDDLAREEWGFARDEARYGVGGILRSNKDCLWVSSPDRIVVAEYKPWQLALAREVGLRIPRTLLTNDPQAARKFFMENQSAGHGTIYKTLAFPDVPAPDGGTHVIYTSQVGAEDLEDEERVRTTACLFQRLVRKAFELRITIVGNRVFTARINSQDHEMSSLDFRASYESLTYAGYDLPSAVRDALLRIMTRCGLQYAAIDMIVTPQDDYVFLELNPTGQWGWIEDALEFPISNAIADLLVDHRNALP